MKIVNDYVEGDRFPVLSLSEVINSATTVDEINPSGILFYQSLSDMMSVYNENYTRSSSYVNLRDHDCDARLNTMFNEDIVCSILVHGTVRSRKSIIPSYGDYTFQGYRHHDMVISEDRFVDMSTNKVMKSSITSNFTNETIKKYAYGYLENKLEERAKEKSNHSHDISISAAYLVYDSDDGKARLEPVEWLCFLKGRNLRCQYSSHNGILHPIDSDDIVENGIEKALDRGFTITVL